MKKCLKVKKRLLTTVSTVYGEGELLLLVYQVASRKVKSSVNADSSNLYRRNTEIKFK